jgi:recombination protein RecA
LATGIEAVDDLIGGGFPRGQVSEVFGPASSGRTGLALALVASLNRAGSLVAWVDPADRLDPASAAASGIDLGRLFWVRGQGRGPDGRALLAAVSALGTLVGSGLFELVVFDVAGVAPAVLHRLPGTTWIRLQRALESQPLALLLLTDAHVAHGPLGVSLAVKAKAPRWTGLAPGRLLRGLGAEARAARQGHRAASLELQAPL